MEYFSLKNSLSKLISKKYDNNINETLSYLVDNYDEMQLRVLSQHQGLKIDNNLIRLFFIENVGFRCVNEKTHIYGKLPICNNIEKYMNSLYLDFINNTNL